MLEARRRFYRSGGSASRRLRELMPTDELRISADSLHSTSIRLTHLKNLLNSDYVDLNRPAIDVDSDHSIGRNTEQGSTTSTDEECSSLMLLAPGEVSRTDDGENTCRKSPEISSSAIAHKKYQCIIECGLRFHTPQKLKDHTRIHSGKLFSCRPVTSHPMTGRGLFFSNCGPLPVPCFLPSLSVPSHLFSHSTSPLLSSLPAILSLPSSSIVPFPFSSFPCPTSPFSCPS